MRTAKILQLPQPDALWKELHDLSEELHDLVGETPSPEVVEGIPYDWTRESNADVRTALALLLEARGAARRGGRSRE
jgi:hypothetical protein